MQHDVEEVVEWVLMDDILHEGVPAVAEPSKVLFVIDAVLMPEVAVEFQLEQVHKGGQVEILKCIRWASPLSTLSHHSKLQDMFPKPAEAVNVDGAFIIPCSHWSLLDVVVSEFKVLLSYPAIHSLAFNRRIAIYPKVIRRCQWL